MREVTQIFHLVPCRSAIVGFLLGWVVPKAMRKSFWLLGVTWATSSNHQSSPSPTSIPHTGYLGALLFAEGWVGISLLLM